MGKSKVCNLLCTLQIIKHNRIKGESNLRLNPGIRVSLDLKLLSRIVAETLVPSRLRRGPAPRSGRKTERGAGRRRKSASRGRTRRISLDEDRRDPTLADPNSGSKSTPRLRPDRTMIRCCCRRRPSRSRAGSALPRGGARRGRHGG